MRLTQRGQRVVAFISLLIVIPMWGFFGWLENLGL